ncbi:reverse transcriptase domain-containing protein [Tanacetum coccineum]
MPATRGSGKVTTMEAQANKTKGIRCLEHTLLGQSRRRDMLDLYLYATSANFTIMDRVLNQQTRTCYEYGSLRHYKRECPIVKFQNRMDMIHGRVMAPKPKIMQDEIESATKLMDKKISTLAKCQAENKRKLDDTSKKNQNQQNPNKRQNTDRAYTAGHEEKKHYGISKPLCSKCHYHHDGPCAPKCHKCNRVGHLAHDCRSSINANTTNNQRGTRAGARGVVHAFGGEETEQDLNNIEDEIEA